ncbi:hypothetical protein KIF59_23080 [Enterobacter cloacae subsp. cloacae]|nr:hypothetical protein [Enterobacter cloacae subsp. cloacae]
MATGQGGDFHLARDHVNGDDHVRAFRPGKRPDGSVTVVVRSCAPFASGWSGCSSRCRPGSPSRCR